MSEFIQINTNVSPLMPTVLVGTATEGKVNFMTAAWCTRVNSEPPLIAVAIGKGKTTSNAIQKNRQFSICIPNAADVAKTDFCGMNAGAKTDKSKVFSTFTRGGDAMPLITDCPVNLECALHSEQEMPDTILFIAEITAAYADVSAVNDGKFSIDRTQPLLYAMDNKYYVIDKAVGAAWEEGKKFKL